MKIIIIGAGQIGSNLASKLVQENHAVTLIDRDASRLKEIEKVLDIQTISQSISPKLLVESGIKDADMLIAVTNIDEINLISCLIASQFGVQYKIARVNNPDYAPSAAGLVPEVFGVDMVINEPRLVIDEIMNLVHIPGATDVAIFSNNKIELVAFYVTDKSQLANRKIFTLRDLEAFNDHLIVAIQRGHETIIPHGQTEIMLHDKIYIIGRSETVNKLSPLLGYKSNRMRSVAIAGGNILSAILAEKFYDQKIKVKIIEPNLRSCYQLHSNLQHATIINGKPADIYLLREEQIKNVDMFIANLPEDDANLLSCFTAKKEGVKRTVAILRSKEYIDLAGEMGIDIVISPQITSEGTILKYIRKGKVLSVASLKGMNAELLEIQAEVNSPIIEKPIMQLSIPKGVIIGAINRGGNVIIPNGHFQVNEGDIVTMFHLPMDTTRLSLFFQEM